MNDDHLVRIERKLDKVVSHISAIDVTLARNTVSLEEHIRRTNLLEQQVSPLQKRADMAMGAFKLIGFTGGAVGFIAAVAELIVYFKTGSL